MDRVQNKDRKINNLLLDDQFGFISSPDKEFITAFDEQMQELGYDCGNKIGSGYCWGKYMLIYTKSGVKSKRVYARIYIREQSILLRLFFNDIDKHRYYIEHSPPHIKEVFTEGTGDCQHCHNDKGGMCRFRKEYTLDDRHIEKCNGITFEFHDPSIARLADYMALFTEFYPGRKNR